MQAQEECSQLERRLHSLEASTSDLRDSHAQRLADTEAEASQRLARLSNLEAEKASLADELRAQAEEHKAKRRAMQEVQFCRLLKNHAYLPAQPGLTVPPHCLRKLSPERPKAWLMQGCC